MNTRLILRHAVRETMGLVLMGVALFWSAGRLGWTPAWAVLALMAAWTIGMALAILRGDPSLLAERLGPRKGAKSWDTTILLTLRTALEDRTLQAELSGYSGFNQQTRFRLISGVW